MKIPYVVALVALVLCTTPFTGCETVNSGVAQLAVLNLKSVVESKIREYEQKSDFKGLREYLRNLLQKKPEGWDAAVEKLVVSKLAEVNSICLRAEIEAEISAKEKAGDYARLVAFLTDCQKRKPEGWNSEIAKFVGEALFTAHVQAKCKQFGEQKDFVGMALYLQELKEQSDKIDQWNDKVAAFVDGVLARIDEKIVAIETDRIWNEVRDALQKKDFATARSLTSTAAPFAYKKVAPAVLIFRIGLLNAVVNPYQAECVIEQMERDMADGNKEAVEAVHAVKDEFPTIHQKLADCRVGLEHLFWCKSSQDALLEKYDGKIQEVMDRRLAAYNGYAEILLLISRLKEEMQGYVPVVKSSSGEGLANGSDNYIAELTTEVLAREFTTEKMNEKIMARRGELLK